MANRTIKNVRFGDVLKVREQTREGVFISEKEYLVHEVYRYYVIAYCGAEKRCFTLGDLVMLGFEPEMVNV